MKDTRQNTCRIAVFVTPHGFGHAARASSVMEALHALHSAFEFDIYTSVPSWFFKNSLTVPYTLHDVVTDVGLVQTSALAEDLPATVDRLDGFLPFDRRENDWICDRVSRRQCRFIICDIAPLGIHVARKTGIPSVLVENFTWDWIYRGYGEAGKRLNRHIRYLENVFAGASIRIQTEPLCQPDPSVMRALPACRTIRETRQDVRRKLGVSEDRKMVLVTMGGVPERYTFFETLNKHPDIFFVIPGGSEPMHVQVNIVSIPQDSLFYHPDLANAADAVIGKAGYSTIAEVYHAGIPFGYVPRPTFPESEKLSRFIEAEIPCVRIQPDHFHSGAWVPEIHRLIETPRIKRSGPNGADQIAEFIIKEMTEKAW